MLMGSVGVVAVTVLLLVLKISSEALREYCIIYCFVLASASYKRNRDAHAWKFRQSPEAINVQ